MAAQSSRFCFTLNNYTDAELARVRSAAGGNRVRYCIFGKEVGA